MKKNNIFKYVLIVALGVAVLIYLALNLKFETVNEHNDRVSCEAQESIDDAITIRIKISCENALSDKEKVPESIISQNGIILSECEFTLPKDTTADKMMIKVCEQNGIAIDMDESTYIRGIGYLYERDLGPLSGWMYRVNGLFPSVACGEYVLSDGDFVEFVYTCDLGADVGDKYGVENE